MIQFLERETTSPVFAGTVPVTMEIEVGDRIACYVEQADEDHVVFARVTDVAGQDTLHARVDMRTSWIVRNPGHFDEGDALEIPLDVVYRVMKAGWRVGRNQLPMTQNGSDSAPSLTIRDKTVLRVASMLAGLMDASPALRRELRGLLGAREVEDAIFAEVQEETRHIPDLLAAAQKAHHDGYETAGVLTLDMARWAFERDDARTSAIDSKSSGLLAGSGTCLAILAGFTGLYLKELPTAAAPEVLALLATLYVTTLLLLGAGMLRLWLALAVRGGWRGLHQDDLFKRDELATPMHKASLSLSVWQLYRANKRVNDTKAAHLKAGQALFLAAVLVLLVLSVCAVAIT